ncbi:GNAT family N-acetyltransferase [Parashewanella curva]|uniref:GNAT family N-acetyltransferase n=1 Tax=Parashewanella curva TaxID=2338552 RepID=A0A3L8Q1H2_9GAMM|nr:GNAT family N-acetyltransferase [Parashewanella curva]RLV61481.1 GNAT family N-acetyltransferase [Parashewanella curva]
MNLMIIRPLEKEDFNAVIKLGCKVHGAGYIDDKELSEIYLKGIKNGINPHFVAYKNNELVGFRLTYAAGQWQLDRWCTSKKWPTSPDDVCYFKCNTVAEEARGEGLGGKLLDASIQAVKQQGAKAGVSHLWKQSPNNAAVKYFTKAGGELIKEHPNRWNWEFNPDYDCALCRGECQCTACEMILVF